MSVIIFMGVGIVLLIGLIIVVVYFMVADTSLYAKGVKTFEKGQYLEAQKQFETALQKDKFNPDLKWYLAQTYEARKLYQPAIEQYHSLTRKSSAEELFKPIDVHKRLAELYLLIDDKAMAEQEIQTLIGYNPHDPVGYVRLGDLAKARGNTQKAIDTYRRALALDPQNTETLKALGFCYISIHHWEEALSFLKRYVSVVTKDYEALYELGLAAVEAGRSAEALKYFERAAQSPNWADESNIQIAKIQLAEGNRQSALAQIQNALKADIKNTELKIEAYYIMSQIMAQDGNLSEAYKYWERIYHINPNYRDVAQKLNRMGALKTSEVISDLLSMPHADFKETMSKLVETMGHRIERDISTQDGKIRFITVYKDRSDVYNAVIETGKWTNPIGELNVRELVRLVQENRAYKGVYITPSSFTDGARETTEAYPVDLIDATTLERMVAKVMPK